MAADEEMQEMATDGGAVFAASFHELSSIKPRVIDFILEGIC